MAFTMGAEVESQLEMDLSIRTWGGARAGAGRKPKRGRRPTRHEMRPSVSRHHPQHVVTRVVPEVGRLRRPSVYHAIDRALESVLDRSDFRICHASIQADHLHNIAEAQDERALSRGMQSLQRSMAHWINAELGRVGDVFEYRYHATPITSPRQARNALAYVLNNWRRHHEDEACEAARYALLDPYSSGILFDGWDGFRFEIPSGYAPLHVSAPQTWLLRTGWRKHGLLDPREVPVGTRPT
jgi:REP element-mobilizing transposase RayT